MKRETFVLIKKNLKPFIKVVESISIAFNSPLYITLRVILSNICFDPKGTAGYDHKNHVEQIDNHVKTLREIRDYFKEDHIVQWIADEILMTIEGNEMLEVETTIQEGQDILDQII